MYIFIYIYKHNSVSIYIYMCVCIHTLTHTHIHTHTHLGFPWWLSGRESIWVQSLSQEDPLKKEMAAWEIPWTEEPGRLQSMGLQRVRHN